MNVSRQIVLFSLCVFHSLFFLSCHHGNKSSDNFFDSCNGDCFPNGVAAGDVDQTSVMLWARAAFDGTVQFEYVRDDDPATDEDPDFQQPDGVEEKEVDTVMDADGNITDYIPTKVELTGLLPGTKYYYRACRDSCSSDIAPESEAWGKFRTPHANGNHGLKFGVSSCFRGDLKPFQSISNVPDKKLDFFVSVGDTAYADSSDSGGQATNIAAFRKKYRDNFSQVNSAEDNFFAKLRESTAFYATIDDHEVVDNFSGGAPPDSHKNIRGCQLARAQAKDSELRGTELDSTFNLSRCLSICNDDFDVTVMVTDNDDPDDKPQIVKFESDPDNPNCNKDFINDTSIYEDGLQAWHEYNPVSDEEDYGNTGDTRTANEKKLYRYRTFGKDAAMFVLDTRSFRDEPSLLLKNRPNRTILGKVQLEELFSDLRNADNRGITWKFIMISVPIQDLGIDANLAGSTDRFEGYTYERGEILDFIETNCIDNVVFISGDIHANIVNNLTYQNPADFLLNTQRFSTAWDITTGPGAYSKPIGATVTGAVPGDPILGFDEQFQIVMDAQLGLANKPRTGLGPEIFLPPPPFQQKNRIVPVEQRLLTDPRNYVNGHSHGWTEFNINAADQKLTVTTYGIDWYEPETVSNMEPSVIGQFVVNPFFPANEGENCLFDTDCISCRCSILTSGGLFQCDAKLPNGGSCTFDNECVSDRCVGIPPFATCQAKEPNGGSCTFDVDCTSGRCVGIPPLAECRRKLQTGESCTFNVDCISGSCTTKLIPPSRTCD